MKPKSIEWLTAARADARSLAESIRHALAEQPGQAVVLPNRQLAGAPSVMTLASLLYGTLRFPAIVLVCDDLVDSARRAIAETVPHASIQVIDWCHPAPAEPADITLLGESQLPRTAGTIAGYDAATIAIFTGIRATPQARYHQAIRWLLHAANDPLIVLEEWTHPDIIAAAVARLAGIAEHDAQVRVNRWLDQTFDPAATARPPYPSTSALLAARDLCARPQRAAA